jgi:hypothetical protein
MDVKTVGINPKELDMVESRKFLRDECLQHFQIPPEIMGIIENSNRATIDSSFYLFAKNVVKPELEWFERILNRQLCPEYDDDLVCKHNFEIAEDGSVTIWVEKEPFLPTDKKENYAYVMTAKNGEPESEPFIPEHVQTKDEDGKYAAVEKDEVHGGYPVKLSASHVCYVCETEDGYTAELNAFDEVDSVLIDYYTPKKSGARQIEISPEKFGGNYYLEASTLFRDTNGVDMPAEFIIPNCKIQSNFTFTMASSGDPSTFTFTMDAFPDYTRFNKSKKVLAAIQIIDSAGSMELHRKSTKHDPADDAFFVD